VFDEDKSSRYPADPATEFQLAVKDEEPMLLAALAMGGWVAVITVIVDEFAEVAVLFTDRTL
jgi:hypothetical protein